MKKSGFAAALAFMPALMAGCATTHSTVADVNTTATVAASSVTTPPARTILCAHPVVTHPAFTAQKEFFPKDSPARRFVGNFALVRTMDGQAGLNPLFPPATSRTHHPAFDGQPFNINVITVVGNAVTITVPKDLAPYAGTPINGIDSSAASVKKYFPPLAYLPDRLAGPISTMRIGEVRHAQGFSVYANDNGCYYLDTRSHSWRDQIGAPDEVAIKRIAGGFHVVSATAKWQAFYPVTITKAQDVAASRVAPQTAPPQAGLP